MDLQRKEHLISSIKYSGVNSLFAGGVGIGSLGAFSMLLTCIIGTQKLMLSDVAGAMPAFGVAGFSALVSCGGFGLMMLSQHLSTKIKKR